MRKRWNQPGSLFARPARQQVVAAPARKRFWFNPFSFIGRLYLRLSMAIGVVFLTSFILGMMLSSSVVKDEKLPSSMILTLRLKDGLIEQPMAGSIFTTLQDIGKTIMTTQDMIETIDHARTDKRVKALAVDIQAGDFGVTHVQELRAAIKRFRASGKPAWVYSPSYAEAGGSMGTYYLAAAFDEIWMQPVGMLSVPGFDAEMPFMAEALRNIGVEPQFFQRKEYKSVLENLSRSDMSPENREMMLSLLNDITNVLSADIAVDRKLPVASVMKAIDQGMFTDREALAAKLVDRVDYADVLLSSLRRKLGSKPGDDKILEVEFPKYRDATKSNPRGESGKPKPKIALISAAGEIVSDAAGGAGKVTPEDITAAFDDALKDKDIRAIVFRVASPGGSPTASETIRRAVQKSVAANKPVIVSMGSMAGSGGYWIIADATHIFALPATLTGSIGVAGGRVAVAELMKKLHVNWDGVQIGKNADMNSLTKAYTESGRERMDAVMDAIYIGFTDRVAKGRKIDPAEVERIAKGRVWTGHQALGLGLVDEIGSLDDAYDYTARMVGLSDRTQIDIVQLPRPKNKVEQVFELLNIEVMMDRVGGLVLKTLGRTVREASISRVSVYDPVLDQKF